MLGSFRSLLGHVQARLAWVVLAPIVCAIACGVQDDLHALQEDPVVVSSLAGNVSDASRKKETFTALFTSNVPVDDKMRKRYARYSYRAKERPEIDGDAATIQVLVRDRMDNELGVIEWRAARQENVWKLDFVDLPPNAK